MSWLVVMVGGTLLAALASAMLGGLREYSVVRLEERLGTDERRLRYQRMLQHAGVSSLTALVLRGMGTVAGLLGALLLVLEGSTDPTLLELLTVAGLGLGVVVLAGTILPSLWGEHCAERVIIVGMPVLVLLDLLLRPLTALIQVLDVVGKRVSGAQEIPPVDQIEDEILDGLTAGEREHHLDAEQTKMIRSIFEFHDTDVQDIITPRTDVVMIQKDTPIMEAVREAIECGHSRIPVFGENRDEVVGILYAKDLLKKWMAGRAEEECLEGLLRRPFFVPETAPVGKLLREMQERRVHLAVVLDEYGGCEGIVTIEDIIEEIVGEIEDEHDPGESTTSVVPIQDGVVECSGLTHIDQLSGALGVELQDSNGELDTVGGYVFSHLGRIPQVESAHVIGALRFSVLAGDERRINRLRVEVIRSEES